MGCHTSFLVPFIDGRENIIQFAKHALKQAYKNTPNDPEFGEISDILDGNDDQQIQEMCFLFGDIKEIENWVAYQDVETNSVNEYNRLNGTNYHKNSKFVQENWELFEYYSDEPRISGYPDKIIHSYEEMLCFVLSGFIDDKGFHHHFYFDKDREVRIWRGIKEFFTKHPDGIITFG